jgi:xanthine dehydrogenase small subunit
MEFHLNGTLIRSDGLPGHTTLLDFVRSRGLTGSKEGCAEGECGACTVALLRPHGDGSQYVPVNSCLIPLAAVAGQEVYTVEALARGGELCEAQQAMVDLGGSQCGYCTPGFVVSMFCEQYRPDRIGPIDPHALAGNLCRCTGYRPIRDAALSLGAAPADAFRERMTRPAPARGGGSLAECLEILAFDRSAQAIAGGTDLMVESNLRYRRFPRLVSIEGLPELRRFADTAAGVSIGAGLALSEIGALWVDAPPTFRDWLALFASPLIRNRATLGGNLATASPIGDAAPLLLAMDASVRIASLAGERVVPLSSFFQDYRVTALGAGELLVSVEIPKPIAAGLRFYKVAKRRADDISTVAAGIGVMEGSDGRIESARFAFGGVAATPMRAREAEEAVLGREWNGETIRLAQGMIGRTLKPISDHRGSAAYRLALAQSLLEKASMSQEADRVLA